eukprot:783915-Pyramimonas_sp.AAC.1
MGGAPVQPDMSHIVLEGWLETVDPPTGPVRGAKRRRKILRDNIRRASPSPQSAAWLAVVV